MVCAPATPSVACGDSSPVKGELYFVGRDDLVGPHSKRNTTPKRRAGEDTGPYKPAAPLGVGADVPIGPYIRHSERSEESVPCSFVPGQEDGFFACGSE